SGTASSASSGSTCPSRGIGRSGAEARTLSCSGPGAHKAAGPPCPPVRSLCMTTESTEQPAPAAGERSAPNVVIIGAGPAGLMAPLPALLQDPEREGVGRPVHGDPSRLGRAADQEPVALPSRVGGPQAQATAAQEGQVEAGDEPDRGVQLPQVRPGDDVGTR